MENYFFLSPSLKVQKSGNPKVFSLRFAKCCDLQKVLSTKCIGINNRNNATIHEKCATKIPNK